VERGAEWAQLGLGWACNRRPYGGGVSQAPLLHTRLVPYTTAALELVCAAMPFYSHLHLDAVR
jgi:hypothetical protein